MGSKLAVLAAQLICLAGTAHADKEKPADLLKKGVAAYKAGHYDEAVALIAKAYEQEPRPETLFTLAQAERLAGHCDAAIPHYKQLLANNTDLNIAKIVETSLALCPQPTVVEPPKPVVVEPPKPVVIEVPKRVTITREVRHTDGLAVGSIVLGGIALGAGGALYVASSSLASSADHARTLDDYTSQHDRADRDRTIGFVVGGVGVALVGFAVFRFMHGDPAPASTEVAIMPASGGGTLVLGGSF